MPLTSRIATATRITPITIDAKAGQIALTVGPDTVRELV
jgi:hypothetical protein